MMRKRGGSYSAGISRRPSAVPPTLPASRLYGIGVDVLQISRMAGVHERHPERLARRLLHPLERERFEQARNPTNVLAKCFSVKEAFVKALGTGFRGIAHDEIGWVRGPLGKPQLVVSERVQRVLDALGIGDMHVTISDEIDLICAVVILERR